MSVTSIPQHKVSKVWMNISQHCRDKGCLSECEDGCNFGKAKSYLHDFTKAGRKANEGLEDIEFSTDDNRDDFDKAKMEEFLGQVEGLCQHCGAYHMEECFVNRSRQALQMIIHGKITEFDPW
ncbi:hypothetical protein [Fuchsiella alkaliacetigena]|uniref:hypothetical protein n=1 Tax=Fuchsiella alkaliacetigena TaxID=957042 RepID=UPI00200A8B69|nr:hypothetical protein [Fuchsiella alkaliacetigena]MCK8824835.1 hypothetical protein [Fuchsiella alkaliacetigena]